MDVNTPDTVGTENPLKRLEEFGQSPWLDFIQRSFVANGLEAMIDRDGLKGMTSNPAIFEKAMGHGTDYDEGFAKLAKTGDQDALGLYEALAIEDIQAAADTMMLPYIMTGKVDGYVSLEVSPYLALRTEDTVEEARRLWKTVGRENVMIKVPGTEAGIPAIRTLISEGMNINVTLLFAQSAYQEVANAYMAGLEQRLARGESIEGIASVASFFVSRIDGAIDKKIDEMVKAGNGEVRALRGKVAIANAKMAYQYYLGVIGSPRWKRLAAAGAMPQRLLWASTGTKDKAYRDVLYVEELIGRDTVNTLPPATMDAFRDHGKLRESLTEDTDGAETVLYQLSMNGIDLDVVTRKLVEEGVQLFADSADKLLEAVANKRVAMLGDRIAKLSAKLPDELEQSVKAAREAWRSSGKLRDLWAGDAKLWTDQDEAKWLGWLRVVDGALEELPALQEFQDEIEEAGFKHVVLLGMGGSSLGPEVLAKTFGKQAGFPELLILDSTDPAQVAALQRRIDLAKTLFIVSSKSGTTLEPNIFKAYFWDLVKKQAGGEAGKQFVAVTDPGSRLEQMAKSDGFRRVFLGDPAIGGRYSVLSNFGLVPGAAMGMELRPFLRSASLMVRSCAAGTPPDANPGIHLGLILGEAAKAGRDKVTIFASPGLADVGAWLEQLLAESTGKQRKGIVPVDGEPVGPPRAYGQDRLFAYLRLEEEADPAQEAAIAALEEAGHPVVRMVLPDPIQVGQAFFLWEFATAVAGSVLEINPFDQPDVEASKLETRKLTNVYAQSGRFPPQEPLLTEDGITLYTGGVSNTELGQDGLDAVIARHLGRVKAGDYVALLAYVDRNQAAVDALTRLRTRIRDAKRVATCVGFGPRFLHSTGQAYKGGPNTGVFLQITADDAKDVPVPGGKYTFGVVKTAQAQGDFEVLTGRERRALRVHLGADVQAGLARLAQAVEKAL